MQQTQLKSHLKNFVHHTMKAIREAVTNPLKYADLPVTVMQGRLYHLIGIELNIIPHTA